MRIPCLHRTCPAKTRPPGPDDHTRLRALRRLARDRSGITAIEFALVGPLLLVIIFGILEIGMSIWAAQVLENAGLQAVRIIRTGQAYAQNYDATRFRDAIARQLSDFAFDADRLTVDVKVMSGFSNPPDTDIIDENGNMDIKPGYSHGGPSDIVLVRIFYRWPLMASHMIPHYANMTGGDRLLASAYLFRNEPFPRRTASGFSGHDRGAHVETVS